jgi:microcystin-dependent protein
MPSTFTDSGIELIADGEQTGTWGDTTNLNLQIIDRLTSQAGTISLSGTTHTLTVSDGVLSDGQYGVLVFAGSPSGTNTVTINPNTAQRTFFVRNTTAQSVVLSQGSGANVTVPSNTSKIVYTNGSGAGATVFDITNTVATNVTGNAGTATALQTARTLTIGSTGKTFSGTANVAWTLGEIGVNNGTLTLATSGIATGSQTFTANQGTNATFTVNVPATNLSVTGGTTAGPTINSSTGTNVVIPSASGTASGVITTAAQTFAGVKTFSSTITGSVSGNAGTATALQTARTIGGVSFNGTANINLPGVNQTGNQNTTGSAASLTTARTINGVSFNGTANITLPTVNTSGDQSVAGVKTFTTALAVTGTSKAAGQFYAGTTAPTATTRLNYDGAFHATSFVGDGSSLTGIEGVPTGIIAIWSGSVVSIPSGWALCDGTSGTPDLRDRFIVGAGNTYAVDATGGANTVSLAEANLAAHTHSVSGTTASDGAHTHNVSGNTAAGGDHSHNFNTNTGDAGDHAHNGSTSNTGAHTHTMQGSSTQPGPGNFVWSLGNPGTIAPTGPAGAHSHNFTTANAGTHSHNFNANTGNSGNHTHTLSGTADSAGAHTHSFSTTSGSTGSGTAHENRPPYYALAYIMKT